MTADPSTSLIFDVDEHDFERRVLQRSHGVPVVVDFWAEWCGPCRTLGPQLERAVAARGGAVELARVDVDANPSLAGAFSVRSIPFVLAFAEGRVVDEFIGAQPPAVVEAFMDALVPSAAQRAADEAAGLDPEAAVARWQEVLHTEPDNVTARVGLATLALDRGAVEDARTQLKPVEHAPEAAATVARLHLLEEALDSASPLAPAAALAIAGDAEPALETLLAAVQGSEGGERTHARGLMVDVFAVLGEEHPLTSRYRRALTAALF